MKNIKKLIALPAALLMLTGCGKADDIKAPMATTSETAALSVADDSEYIYCVGSVSKVYSTAAIMQLAGEGKIDIDKPVTEYIPDFRLADERYRDITVRMLMDHTSGIMGSTLKNAMLYGDNDQSSHDNMTGLLSSQRLKADPGRYAAYCNDGFVLLEIIIENVSGMSFTDYVEKNIAGRLGLENTGTPVDMIGSEKIVPAIRADNTRLDTEYCMGIGSGGVFATASDNALFGASFFTGDNRLLSEEAKNAMATRWSDSEYGDASGLGWDYAEMPYYKAQGIKLSGKGGAVAMNQSFLWCAPDEKISVSVLTNGGSCTYNALVGTSLLDIALEDKGVNVADSGAHECTTVAEIPAGYEKYAGWYIVNIMGSEDTLYHISFPESKYMHVEETTQRRTTCTDYLLTTDGDFAELAYEVEESGFDKRLAAGHLRLSFEENADGTFLRMNTAVTYPGLGTYDVKQYTGQKIEENDVGEDVINEYRSIEDKAFLLCSDKYSSSAYDEGITRLYVIDRLKGYVFMGDMILKMTDKDHLTAVNNTPSSSSRDLCDITLERDGNGISALKCSNAQTFIPEDRAPMLDVNVKNVAISENAQWYNISDSIANSAMTVSRPENSAVYVYNKYGEVIYTTHNKDARHVIPMPKGGKVLFLGEQGDEFKLGM